MKTIREVSDYIKSKHYDVNPFNLFNAASLVVRNLESNEEILFACTPYTALYRTRDYKDDRLVQSEITDFGQGILVITNLYAAYVKNNKLFRKPVVTAKESMWHFIEAESSVVDDDFSIIILSFRASQISLCVPTAKKDEIWKDVIQAIEQSEYKTRVKGLKKFAELFGATDETECQKAHEEALNKSLKELLNMMR